MSRLLNDLSFEFKPIAIELLARLVESKINILITDTLRTQKEHKNNLIKGTSWVKHSKHLDGNAIDIVPYKIYNLYGINKLEWDTNAIIWIPIGEIGESLGLIWGGRWKKKDMGHFELR